MLFWKGSYWRGVTPGGCGSLDKLTTSGLYQHLTERRWLLPHTETDRATSQALGFHRALLPEQLEFTSFPSEWCHSQLRAAALRTLAIQEAALHRGMCMADASAFNIQFHRGDTVLIDTLSLKNWDGSPVWDAYRQFCRHFLAPLALGSYRRLRPGKLGSKLEGPTLETASRLLPWRSWLRPGLMVHLHLHARASSLGRQGNRAKPISTSPTSARRTMEGLAISLRRAVESLTWKPQTSQWSDYYGSTHGAGADYAARKRSEVRHCLEAIQPARVLDTGANTGEFARLAQELGATTVACDADVECVERLFKRMPPPLGSPLLPLVIDLTEPTPALGWNCEERASFSDRVRADATLALALVHHLCITGGIPVERLPDFFSPMSPHLIIEWVGLEDPLAQKIASPRGGNYPTYSQAAFVNAFSQRYEILRQVCLTDRDRTLYWMRRRN